MFEENYSLEIQKHFLTKTNIWIMLTELSFTRRKKIHQNNLSRTDGQTKISCYEEMGTPTFSHFLSREWCWVHKLPVRLISMATKLLQLQKLANNFFEFYILWLNGFQPQPLYFFPKYTLDYIYQMCPFQNRTWSESKFAAVCSRSSSQVGYLVTADIVVRRENISGRFKPSRKLINLAQTYNKTWSRIWANELSLFCQREKNIKWNEQLNDCPMF